MHETKIRGRKKRKKGKKAKDAKATETKFHERHALLLFYSDLLSIEEIVPQKIVRQCQKNLVKGLMITNAQGHKYK